LKIHVIENRRENQEWTIQRNETGNIWYARHRTNTIKAKNTTQKTKKMSNTDSTKMRRASSSCLPQDSRHVAHMVDMCTTPRLANKQT